MNSTCPLAYRYGTKSIKSREIVEAHTLYVVGGLYGNPHALNTIKQLFSAEYPNSVASEVVERSDAIHRRLSETARASLKKL